MGWGQVLMTANCALMFAKVTSFLFLSCSPSTMSEETYNPASLACSSTVSPLSNTASMNFPDMMWNLCLDPATSIYQELMTDFREPLIRGKGCSGPECYRHSAPHRQTSFSTHFGLHHSGGHSTHSPGVRGAEGHSRLWRHDGILNLWWRSIRITKEGQEVTECTCTALALDKSRDASNADSTVCTDIRVPAVLGNDKVWHPLSELLSGTHPRIPGCLWVHCVQVQRAGNGPSREMC